MKSLDARRMLDDENSPWFPVCYFNISNDAAALILPGSPVIQWVDGLGDADYYCTEFDCGLRLGFEFLHQSGGTVLAPTPSSQHARRHLRPWAADLVDIAIEQDFQRIERDHVINKYSATHPELLDLSSYQVFRMGDDGNAVAVGDATTRSDAECWVAEFESHHHKQIYWIETIKPTVNGG